MQNCRCIIRVLNREINAGFEFWLEILRSIEAFIIIRGSSYRPEAAAPQQKPAKFLHPKTPLSSSSSCPPSL
jgi:hypothetical protein